MTTDALERLAAALGDRYRLERELGRGGMAAVYLARDLKHERDVAIKVTLQAPSEDGGERFLREVRIVARLNHPHILPLHDSGMADGLPYYVMPYQRGETLRHLIERRGPLPVAEAVALVRPIAYALGYAHQQGVVHRDVKPENILLHEGEPVIADFGVALGGDLRRTEAGIAVGTPLYMSPEQSTGDEDLDARSDVYALGCVLFELLAGRPPLDGRDARALLMRRLTEPAPSIRAFRPEIPDGVDAALRRALAPERRDRFAGTVAFAEALAAPGIVAPRAPVVAVLPFRCISADADAVAFAEGIGEDVIAHLAKVHTLDVIARASVAPYKGSPLGVREIAAALAANALLDGSVRRAGSRVRVVAQLVDGASAQQLWAETYDRDLTDIFEIQTDVALRIVEALRVVLTPDERDRMEKRPTKDLVAYERFLLGRQQITKWTSTGLREGIRLLEEATARDPSFAAAHAQLGMAWAEMQQNDQLDGGLAYGRAMAAVRRAIALDPDLAEAHCVLGHLLTIYDFDWVGAEQAFKRALELEPGLADAWDFYGRFCYAVGRFDEAVAMVTRAHQLDPVAHRSDVPTALLRAKRFEEAAASARSLLVADPDYDRALMTLGWALFHSGQAEEGLAQMRHAMRVEPGRTQWLAQYGQALGLLGRVEEAREILARLETLATTEFVSPYQFAYLRVGLGEFDAAMDALEASYESRGGSIHGVGGSFLFAPLRENPRFRALLERMHLSI